MDNKKIGKFIFDCRKKLGITQQQLAEQIGVSNKAISKWETGEGYPDICTIPTLCKALSISADDFFAGEIVKQLSIEGYNLAENNKLASINRNDDKKFLQYDTIFDKIKWIQKDLIHLLPYFICLVILYYAIPKFFYGTLYWQLEWPLLIVLPVGCFACGLICSIKYKFSVTLALGAGVLFLPTMCLYMDGNDQLAINLSILYCCVSLLGGIIIYISKKYSVVLIKKTSNNVEKVQ